MRTPMVALAGIVALAAAVQAAEFHVATSGNDANPGTQAAPLRTIQRAAELAQPGDVITVHEGVYRERINPPRGGESDAKRIVYQAAPGEKVEIKGSEVVKNWVKVQDDVWKVTLPNSFFGGFNPYSDLIRGDWFNPKGRAASHRRRLSQRRLADRGGQAGRRPEARGRHRRSGSARWTTRTPRIWAQFKGVNPNEQLVEINVRRTVFYPGQAGPQLHHRARLHHAPRRHALGAAHRRADRPDRHPLEQGLDHREQRRSATRSAPASRSANTATSATTPRPTPPRATSRPSSAPMPIRSAGPRRTSATTSSATTPSRTASRRASSAASAPSSAPSPATPSTTSTSGGCSPARRWPASSSTPPSTPRSAATTSTAPAAGSGWTGWPRARASRGTSSTTTPARTCSSR